MGAQDSIPFHTFLWKIASRCNLACSYCYVYNRGDEGWRNQPKFMTPNVARRTAQRMREHLEKHQKQDVSIVFHGGEPMLGGPSQIRELTSVILDTFAGSGVRVQAGMQSNLTLFDAAMADTLLALGIPIGVSIDGPPHVNDRYRLDHQGRGSAAVLEKNLEILTSPTYRPLFSGFLCVIDPSTDPIEVTDYLLSFAPPSIDFLFPLDNHDRLPRGKEGALRDDTPYADWLIRAFDRWVEAGTKTRIRLFTSLVQQMCGADSLFEGIGLGVVDLIVVEANGEIEGVDSLKAAFNGAARLGFNVFDHHFDEVAEHIAVRSRQLGVGGLCRTCQECPVVGVCGGGYMPHRYSSVRGFDNPSVYCTDLSRLIRHINGRLRAELRTVEREACL